MVNEANEKIWLVLVAGGSYLEREKRIATAFNENLSQLNPLEPSPSALAAVILEGLPTGSSLLQTHSQLLIERVASGCFCCAGQLVMKVTLHRLLRKHPRYIYIGMIDAQHLANLQHTLSQPPYQTWLKIEKVIQLP